MIYIPNQPLHPCLMSKACNHSGIQICGFEKDNQAMRVFLDDCDMFEYNCDYKKGYSKVDDHHCNFTISASTVEESTSLNYPSPTTIVDKDTTSNSQQTAVITQSQFESITTTIPTESMTTQIQPESNITTMTTELITTQTQLESENISIPTESMTTQIQPESNITTMTTESITTQIQPDSEIITITTESITPVSDIITAKCTCMDLQTIPVSTNESTISSTQSKHDCQCAHSHSEPSSMKTLIDNTTELTLNTSETTAVANFSESPSITESIIESTNVNDSSTPIATECTRGTQNSTSTSVKEKQNTDSVTETSETISTLSTNTVISDETKKKCTCMDKEISTKSSDLVTHSSTTSTFLTTEEFTTSPKTKTIQTRSESISTLAEKRCTCNFVTRETMTTKSQTKSEIITIPTTLSTETTINLMSTTQSIITSPQAKDGCTCTNSHSKSSSLITINDKTTPSTTLNKEESSEITITTVEYEDETTLKHDSCDKYPHHCKRPQSWETTAQGETRDFFQILRERFGDRVKILKDTTHWPRRMKRPIKNENDNFRFGIHNET